MIMKTMLSTLVALSVLAGVAAPASAFEARSSFPERQYVTAPSMAPPMQQAQPMAPLSPRVGY
jgi:hypothetical protein